MAISRRISSGLAALAVLFAVAGIAVPIQSAEARQSEYCEVLLASRGAPFDVIRALRLKGQGARANALLDEVESHLLNGEVLKVEFLGGGVNASFKVRLSDHVYGVFKPVDANRPHKMHREVAAYRLSRRFDLDLVPPTVIRELKLSRAMIREKGIPKKVVDAVDGKQGSFQLYLRSAVPLRDRPRTAWDVTRTGRWLKVFDWWINNHDRGSNHGNYMISDIGDALRKNVRDQVGVDLSVVHKEVGGIDHGVSFVSVKKQARADKVPSYSASDFDIELYRRFSTRTEKDIRESLQGLKSARIDETVERYRILLEEMGAIFRPRKQ